MRAIELLPVVDGRFRDGPDLSLLDEAAAALARRLSVSCHVREAPLDASSAFDPERNQSHSTRILQMIEESAAARAGPDVRVVGVTALDLFVPVLTFVFGEAQLAGCVAVVSLHRLSEEHYGLPPDRALLVARTVKEIVHELGHTLGLRHCEDWRCVMSSAHSVEAIDARGETFCDACGRVFAHPTGGLMPRA